MLLTWVRVEVGKLEFSVVIGRSNNGGNDIFFKQMGCRTFCNTLNRLNKKQYKRLGGHKG